MGAREGTCRRVVVLEDLKRRLYLFIPAIVAVLLHNAIHESVHYLAARLWGEDVLEFRFLTNGWGTSQVIYATPVAERVGPQWLAIAWSPAVVTVLIGYAIYLNWRRWWSHRRWANLLLWYGGLVFLCLDPLYCGILSLVVGGTDVDAVAAVGWSPWPVRLVALAILAGNARLMVRWWKEARARSERGGQPEAQL